MWLFEITKSNGEKLEVYLMKNKNENTFSFVNFTKGHICPCKFNSLSDAIDDVYERVKTGKIVNYVVKSVKNDVTQ